MGEKERPTWNCYWLKQSKVMVGEYPTSRSLASVREKLKGFLDAGFTFFLDLTEPGEMPPYDGELKKLAEEYGVKVEYVRIPVKDVGVPSRETMVKILDTIDKAVAENHLVYVHCRGGIGRTATICGCYLVRHGMSGEEALVALQGMAEETDRNGAIPKLPGTYEQQYFIKTWSENPVINNNDDEHEESPSIRLQRYIGCLIGMALCEAYGVPTQSLVFGRFRPVTELTGGGKHNLKPGQWEDATAMALCIAESLIEKKGFDPVDQMKRLKAWRDTGKFSSTSACFGLEDSIARALIFFEQTNNPFAGDYFPYLADNTCLPRMAPVAMFYRKNPDKAIEVAGQNARLTHGSKTAIDACKYFTGLLIGALSGKSKKTLLSEIFHPVKGTWKPGELHPAVEKVVSGSYKMRYPPTVKNTNYVLDSLEAALWAFYRSENFREGCLKIINLGDDSTTAGAIYGALAGAYYSSAVVLSEDTEKLALREQIENIAKQLFKLSEEV